MHRLFVEPGGPVGSGRRARRAGVAGVQGGWRRVRAQPRLPGARVRLTRRGQMDALVKAFERAASTPSGSAYPTSSSAGVVRGVVSRHDPAPDCSPGRTRGTNEHGGTLGFARTGRVPWRCSIVSERRGSCLRSYVPSAAGERRSCGTVTGLGGSRSSSWPAIPPPPSPSQKRLTGCSRSSEYQLLGPAPGGWQGLLRARSAGGCRTLGEGARPRRPRLRRFADALAAGEGEATRTPRRPSRGGAARAPGARDLRGDRHAQRSGRAVRRPRPGVDARAAGPRTRPRRSSRRLRATSGRRTSSWPTASAHGSRNCDRLKRPRGRPSRRRTGETTVLDWCGHVSRNISVDLGRASSAFGSPLGP